tara:strand:- start:4353 stop:5501 length:1149 start_codon:yes stop_codon:yes gene_type:complete
MKRLRNFLIFICILLGLFFYFDLENEFVVLSKFNELKNKDSKQYYYVTNNHSKIVINIPQNSTIKDVIKILKNKGELKGEKEFIALSHVKDYQNSVKPGKFILDGRYSLNKLVNELRVKKRYTFDFQIKENIRLVDNLFDVISDKFNFDKTDLKNSFQNEKFLQKNSLNIENYPVLFIPNTYEFYSDIVIDDFKKRIIEEYTSFWNKDERIMKLDNLNLRFYNVNSLSDIPESKKITKAHVSILASIVEAEQDKRLDERPKIAGLYLNRLMRPDLFPYLQADPTVIYSNYISGSIENFDVKQVLNKHLAVDNKYNTYKYKGLPPGPIRIPSKNAIDAVLDAEKHDFYFMCAGSNGDGYHEFTSTIRQHNINKTKYKRYQNFK